MTNPSDHFIDIITMDNRSEETKQESKERISRIIEAWQNHINQLQHQGIPQPIPRQWANGIIQETSILFTRSLKETMRDKQRLIATLIQTISLTAIFGLVFLQLGFSQQSIQNRVGLLFFIVINITFTVISPIVNEFPLEKRIIRKERESSSYRTLSLFIARILSGIPILLLANLIYSSGIYWMTGLKSNAGAFFIYLITITITVLFAQSYGLLIGAIADTPQVAQLIGPTFLVILVVFGGNFVNIETLPSYLVWIYWISPIHYSYQALMINEFSGLSFSCGDVGVGCIESGDAVLQRYGMSNLGLWTCILVLAGLTIFCYVVGGLVLGFNTKPPNFQL